MEKMKKFLPIIMASALVIVFAVSFIASAYAKSTVDNRIYSKLNDEEYARHRFSLGYNIFPGHDFKKILKLDISEGFKQRIIEVAKSDPEVRALFDKGYEVRSILPTMKVIIKEDGSVEFKATGAIVHLVKRGVGFAIIEVDLEAGRVVSKHIFERPIQEE